MADAQTWLDLQDKVAKGELSAEEADNIFAQQNLFDVTNDVTDKTILEQITEQAQTNTEENLGEATLPLMNEAQSATQEDLERVANAPVQAGISQEMIDTAQAELDKRARIQEQPFLDTITSAEGLERVGKAALKGPSQMYNAFTKGLPGLALTGGAALTGSERASDAGSSALNDFMDMNQNINEQFGSSDPITATESLGEAAIGAFVPGGWLVKGAGLATDFTVDQTIRELTDEEGTAYDTVFDVAGVPETPKLNQWLALPAAMLGVSLGASAVVKLKNSTVITPPKMKDIIDVDPTGPRNVKTAETVGDELFSGIVDSQSQLTRDLTRIAAPGLDDIEKTVTLNTGSAGAIRVREAVRTGELNSGSITYNVKTPVEEIHKAYQSLETPARKAIATYINAFDQLDDARIALSNGVPGNHQHTINKLTAIARRTEQQFPIVRQFKQKYEEATKAMRDSLEGDVLSSQARQALDRERPNYVPFYEGAVDFDAPLSVRMRQAGKEGFERSEDTFLQQRKGAGAGDLEKRADPIRLLAEYTEGGLHLNLRNNVRKNIVDAIRNSKFGRETIRKATKDDNLSEMADYVVKVYRDGEVENWITSPLRAGLLRFDPYVAKHPAFFAVRRFQEYNMVGPASITFAPVSLMRDLLGAPVVRPKGIDAPSPAQVVSAIPKQVWAKTAEAISTNLNAGLMSGKSRIPFSILPRQARQNLSNLMSRQYLNSMYHTAQQSGGLDASIMRNNIKIGKTMFSELGRSLDEGASSNAITKLVRDHGYNNVRDVAWMFVNLYDSVMDAPRYAAYENAVKKGADKKTAAALARNLVGDVSRTGQVYDATGKQFRAAAVNDGPLQSLSQPTLKGAEFVRESVPFVNPMIQGTRRLIESFIDDPIGTNMRAWATVGLPAVTAYAWNEMLGKEYNDYAFNDRSARDVAMNPFYFGTPGKPPNEGVEIPVMHELAMFAAPFTRAIHALTRNEDGEETSFALQTLLKTIAKNSIAIGMPSAASVGAAAVGVSLPETMIGADAGRGTYMPKEDNIGVLPENIENVIRELFAANGTTALQVAQSLTGYDGDSWDAFASTVENDLIRRTPIVRNVTGRKTSNTYFSIPAEYNKEKEKSIQTMWPYWKEFYAEKYFDELGISKAKSQNFSQTKGLMEGREDLPNRMVGPSLLQRPVNPFYDVFGEVLIDYVKRNGGDEEVFGIAGGISGLDDRLSQYWKIISRIDDYHEGVKGDWDDWQKTLQDVKPDDENISEETRKLAELMDQYDVDLTKYEDRMKFKQLVQNERSFVLQRKIQTMRDIERGITNILREKGLIKEGEEFLIEKEETLPESSF